MADKRDDSTVIKLTQPVDPAMSGALPLDFNSAMTFREIGQSGLRQWSGYVREEFLPNLIGRQGIRTYREMIDSSPIIGGLMTAFSATLRKVDWRTEAPENGKTDQAKIDFADSLREDMSVSWEDTMGETMSMLGYGFAPQEILYKKRDGMQEDPTIPSSKFNDGLIGWRKLPIRGQDTVLKWFFGPNGEILGLTQQPWNAPIRDVPIEKMLLFRNGIHKNNPEGRSLLRNAYRNYFFIKRIEEQEAILFERLNGLPVMRVPLALLDAAEGGDATAIATVALFKKIATNLRIDEQMGVLLPSDVHPALGGATTSAKMYDLELLTPQMSMRGVVSTDVLNRHSTNILISVMADFLAMGHSTRGTQSLAEVKVDVFFQSVESILNSTAAIYNRYALPRAWRLNGFDPATMPDYIPDMAQRVDLDVLSNFVLRMSQAGMPLFPDQEMQSALLDIAGLPDIQDPGALSAAEASASYALEYAPPMPGPTSAGGGKPNLQKTLFGRMIMASMARRYQKMNGASTNYRGPRARGHHIRSVRKFNPNHDELGRFDFGTGSGQGSGGGGEGGAGGNAGLLAAQRAAAEAAGNAKALEGLPVKPLLIDGEYFVPGPNEAARQVAEEYMRRAGLEYNPATQYIEVDPARATEIAKVAKAFDAMQHDPNNPEVAAAYQAMISETIAQYNTIAEMTGLKVDFIPPGSPDPYASSPRLAMEDIRDNNHFWVFPTDSGFGTGAEAAAAMKDNPLLAMTNISFGDQPALANDVFRVVHDYFGHFKEGVGFRASGEDNAWRSHVAMYSSLAAKAMTSETRGQNSWVNYGPYGSTNRTASGADTHFAPQKIGILPGFAFTKFNPNHDERGRFDFGSGVKATGEQAATAVKQGWVQKSPVQTLDEAFALAPDDQKKLVDDAKKAADAVDHGTELKDPGVKGQARAGEKLDEGRPPAAVTDIVRLGFVVPEPALADQIVSDLAKNYAVIDEGWNKTAAGWVDRKVYVRFSDGMIGEVQMWPPAMYNAKMNQGGLQLYSQARSMSAGPARDALFGQMNDLYGAAASRLSQSWKNAIGMS